MTNDTTATPDIVESLPDRPLSTSEFASIEESDAVVLVMPDEGPNVDENEVKAAVIAGTHWAAGIAFIDGSWQVYSRGRFDDDPFARGFFNPGELPEDHPLREALTVFAEHGE